MLAGLPNSKQIFSAVSAGVGEAIKEEKERTQTQNQTQGQTQTQTQAQGGKPSSASHLRVVKGKSGGPDEEKGDRSGKKCASLCDYYYYLRLLLRFMIHITILLLLAISDYYYD